MPANDPSFFLALLFFIGRNPPPGIICRDDHKSRSGAHCKLTDWTTAPLTFESLGTSERSVLGVEMRAARVANPNS